MPARWALPTSVDALYTRGWGLVCFGVRCYAIADVTAWAGGISGIHMGLDGKWIDFPEWRWLGSCQTVLSKQGKHHLSTVSLSCSTVAWGAFARRMDDMPKCVCTHSPWVVTLPSATVSMLLCVHVCTQYYNTHVLYVYVYNMYSHILSLISVE